jgi:hypothetical protein
LTSSLTKIGSEHINFFDSSCSPLLMRLPQFVSDSRMFGTQERYQA